MASTSWQGFALPQVPASITTALAAFKNAVNAVTADLTITKNTTAALAALETDNLSTSQQLIKIALTEIQTSVNELLSGTGVYVLLVPVRRKVVLSPLVSSALAWVGIPELPKTTPSDACLSLAVTTEDQKILDYFRGVASADGGNQGFIRTVLESLNDAGDPNKPTLSAETYVAGAYLVAGAADYLSLVNFIATLTALFVPNRPAASLGTPDLPVPQNLKAQFTAGDTPTIRLTWDAIDSPVLIPTLDTSVTIDKICVVWSQDPSLLTQQSIFGIFGTNDVKLGTSIGTGKSIVEVIAVLDPNEMAFIDSLKVTSGSANYYALSYSLLVGEDATFNGTVRDLKYGKISNIAKITVPRQTAAVFTPRTALGVPPDWYRTPSTIDLVPAMGDVARLFNTWTSQASGFTTTFGDGFKTYITSLENAITAYEELATNITSLVARLTSVLGSHFDTAIAIRGFAGMGGKEFLASDLAAALSPSNTDPLRPAFDNNEFVVGVVALTTAPDAAGVAPVMSILNTLLLGLEATGNPIQAALAQIDVALRAEEEAVYGDIVPVKSVAPNMQTLLGTPNILNNNCSKQPPSTATFNDDFSIKK